uniref:WDR60 protein n=1 Tax=Fopius arisanus TaxID=64838 RepID=A0A0C9RUV4_9HYME
MSNNSSGLKKKPVRKTSKDKQDPEPRKNAVRKPQIKGSPADRSSGRITSTSRPQEQKPMSSKKPLKKADLVNLPSYPKSEVKRREPEKHKRLSSRERRKSRTLSPSEVKILKNLPSPDDEYSDDFEDYESDFQECTETSSSASEVSDSQDTEDLQPVELKQKNSKSLIPVKPRDEEMDSGHYELEEARRRAARVDLMSRGPRSQVFMENSLENPLENPPEIKSLPSSADEGFEDSRSGDFKSPPLPRGLESKGNQEIPTIPRIQFPVEKSQKKLSRGEKLLQMIKLDVVEWSIFEATPIAYEEFISAHGRINTRQTATQTREDDLDVETQTEEIKTRNMWTQFPVVCRSHLESNEDIDEFNRELVGVGCQEEDVHSQRAVYDALKLNEFLGAAGRVMLALLEERKERYHPGAEGGMVFSGGRLELDVSRVNFLSGRPVLMVRYSEVSRILLSIHAPGGEDDVETSEEEFYGIECCIGCLWNIHEPSSPIKLFYSGSRVSAVCMHPVHYNIVIAGLEDGSLSLWNLEEEEWYHKRVVDKDNNVEWVLRSPTFSTVGTFEDEGCARIVALKVLDKIESEERSGKFRPIQICSLDEDGNCTIWSVLRTLDISSSSQPLGQSYWGKIKLVKSHKISLSLEKTEANDFMTAFRDLSVDPTDTNNLFIASNTNKLLHATRTGKRMRPSVCDGNSIDYSVTTCIESCPFGHPLFLVGFSDGSLRLYSSTIEKPLVQLKNSNSTAPVRVIQWSRSKPFTIFVLDEMSNIHIWDLSRSDIFPQHSISPEKNAHIGSMHLSPCRSDSDMINQYLALGLDNGTLEIHKFNKEFHYSNNADRTADLNTFLYYVAVH